MPLNYIEYINAYALKNQNANEYWSDFFSGSVSALSPYVSQVLNAGTFQTELNDTAKNRGIFSITSSVSANSGGIMKLFGSNQGLRNYNGMFWEGIISIRQNNNLNNVIRLGVHNSDTNLLPSFGAFFEFAPNSTNLLVRSFNSSIETQITLASNLIANRFYRTTCQYIRNNLSIFSLYDNDQLIAQKEITAINPTGLNLAYRLTAFSTGTVAQAICNCDWLNFKPQ
jgi:hypothetical protein